MGPMDATEPRNASSDLADVIALPLPAGRPGTLEANMVKIDEHTPAKKGADVDDIARGVRDTSEQVRKSGAPVTPDGHGGFDDGQDDFDRMLAERGDSLAAIDAQIRQAHALVVGMSGADRRRTLMNARLDDDGVLRGPLLSPVDDPS